MKGHARVALADSACLAAAVALSCAWYIGGLGYYSDDWAFIGRYATSADQSLAGLYRASNSPQHAMRPVQVWLCAGLYRAFGLDPLGYHLFNGALLVANAVLVLMVLRASRVPRAIALPAALVYALLPNYSTDRFWFVAFAITLSMTTALLSAYANLRASAAGPRLGAAWKGLSIAAFVTSALAYEVALPLLLVVPALMLWRLRGEGMLDARRLRHVAVLAAIDALLFAGAAAYKVRSTVRLGADQGIARQVRDIVRHAIRPDVPAGEYGLNVMNAVRVHFGQYGVELPVTTVRAARAASPDALAPAAAVGLMSAIYLALGLRRDIWPAPRAWAALVPIGLVVFALGYAIFLTNYNVQFTAAGIANRSAIAAAFGAALCLVGATGGLTTLAAGKRAALPFAVVIGGIAASSVLLVNVIAGHWVRAYAQEQSVLSGLRAAAPRLDANATVILAGTCPYDGPAIVFESHWDLAGALQTIYRDPTLAADVATDRLLVAGDGVTTRIYGETKFYPYGPRLAVYDHSTRSIARLSDREAARRHIEAARIRRPCPSGREGIGVPIFQSRGA